VETLHFEFAGSQMPARFNSILVGVVGSGNLEVMLESASGQACILDITTSARGFGHIWQAVVTDFHARHDLAGVTISINDMGATPAVVSLRLDQAVAALPMSARPSSGAQA
jgi:malonate decarboxylase delta subunit